MYPVSKKTDDSYTGKCPQWIPSLLSALVRRKDWKKPLRIKFHSSQAEGHSDPPMSSCLQVRNVCDRRGWPRMCLRKIAYRASLVFGHSQNVGTTEMVQPCRGRGRPSLCKRGARILWQMDGCLEEHRWGRRVLMIL